MRLPDNPRDGKETRVAYKESQELILRDPSKREKRTPIPIAAHLTIAIGLLEDDVYVVDCIEAAVTLKAFASIHSWLERFVILSQTRNRFPGRHVIVFLRQALS